MAAQEDSTYSQRFSALVDFLDPRTLLVSDEDVRVCAVLVKNHDPNSASSTTAQDHENHEWNQKVVQSALNAKGEIIPRAFRMSSFLLVNVPLIVGMLSAQSTAATIFWQTINQSYNSVNIYYNSGGAGEVQVEELAKNYCIAVGTALGLSLGIRHLGSKPGKIKQVLDRVPFVVPFAAVAGAGGANVYVTRSGDIEKGVPVCNEAGTECYGQSREAGKQAVFKTILTRSVVLNIPVLILPSLLLKAVPQPATPKGKLALEVVVITMCLAGALPATLALYPPKLKLSTKDLEPEFQTLVDAATGQPIEYVFANKGM